MTLNKTGRVLIGVGVTFVLIALIGLLVHCLSSNEVQNPTTQSTAGSQDKVGELQKQLSDVRGANEILQKRLDEANKAVENAKRVYAPHVTSLTTSTPAEPQALASRRTPEPTGTNAQTNANSATVNVFVPDHVETGTVIMVNAESKEGSRPVVEIQDDIKYLRKKILDAEEDLALERENARIHNDIPSQNIIRRAEIVRQENMVGEMKADLKSLEAELKKALLGLSARH